MPATTAAGGLSAWPMAAPADKVMAARILSVFSSMMESYYFMAPEGVSRVVTPAVP
jgi:hypothetical protein